MLRLFFVLIALWPAASLADGKDPGEKLFALHCAACHGQNAKGTGPIAGQLRDDPADLTGIARRNGGVFPIAATVAKIDGRAPFAAHGGAMPVYGWFFDGPSATLKDADGQEIETTEAIAQIVGWLARQQN